MICRCELHGGEMIDTCFVAESRRRLWGNDYSRKNTLCISILTKLRKNLTQDARPAGKLFSRLGRFSPWERATPTSFKEMDLWLSILSIVVIVDRRNDRRRARSFDRHKHDQVDVDLYAIPREVLCVNPSNSAFIDIRRWRYKYLGTEKQEGYVRFRDGEIKWRGHQRCTRWRPSGSSRLIVQQCDIARETEVKLFKIAVIQKAQRRVFHCPISENTAWSNFFFSYVYTEGSMQRLSFL